MGGVHRRLTGSGLGARSKNLHWWQNSGAAGLLLRTYNSFKLPASIAFHLLFCLAIAGYSAEPAAPAATAEGTTVSGTSVGALGRPEAIFFEGNKTFSAEVIRGALRSRVEFLLAAHPAAPLADYPPVIEKMVRVAYLHQGFPDVRVKASLEPTRGQVQVKLEEGPRFKTGGIRITGVKASSDPALQKRLRGALTGEEFEGKRSTNDDKILWQKGAYAPFDEGATAEMKERVLAELAELNYYKPTLKLTVTAVPTKGEGDLVIEIANEGLKGVIDDIGFFYPIDDKKNTDAEMQQYLGLKPGMPLRADLVADITNRLWSSGRFLKQEASVVPLPDDGHFRLELDLEDLEEAPPLHQALSSNQIVVLKFCQWLNEFPRHPEDLVFSLRSKRMDQVFLDLELVVSHSGLAWVARDVRTNGEPHIAYAMVLSSNMVSCFAGWRERKLISPASGGVTAFVSLLPNPQPKAAQPYNFTIGAGVSSERSEQPIEFSSRLAPVKFLEMACNNKVQYKSNGTELEALFPTDEGLEPARVRIDQSTGRPIYSFFEMRTNDLHLIAEARSEKGGYQRLVTEVTQASAGFPNDFVAAYPKSSWLGFVLTDLLESRVMESFAVSNFTAQIYSPRQAAELTEQGRLIRDALERLTTALGKKDLAECLRPFEDKLQSFFKNPAEAKTPDSEEFYVPFQPVTGQNSMSLFISLAAGFVIDKSDAVWPRNSWPWTLVRETGFTLAGQNPYTGLELERLFGSEQTGPLGCWAAAALLARINAPLAEKFARRSLDQLHFDQFEKDLGFLLDPKNAAGQLAAEALKEIGHLKETDVDALTIVLGTNATRLTRAIALAARTKTNQVPVAILEPALTEAWTPLLQPEIAGAVNALLRKVGTPDTPQAAFERASFILQTANKPEEFSEAARVLEFAANQGLAPAQLRLGGLYQNGQGVPLDHHQALNWFVKAADQGEPHAACRVADIYFNGQGVPADKIAAMAWYEREARRGCPRAQFQLGQCAEQQSSPVKALAWYRVAATNGYTEAQTTLAERLSDELLPTPEYSEAYLWYWLAADSGNRVAAVSARRVKRKLTSVQAHLGL